MDFLAFASAHGLDIRRLETGRICRCDTRDKRGRKNGAYLFTGDFGWVQDWATMPEPVYWRDESITDERQLAKMRQRVEESKRLYAAELQRERASAARKAEAIIKQCRTGTHTYLQLKGLPKAAGLVWESDGEPLLVVPMRVNGAVCGCQLIDDAGTKKFLRGQRTGGAEFVIGSGGVDVWCEGFATALSIHTCLGAMSVQARVHAAFSAGNLQRMATRGFVVADNDASETGEKAAQATGLPFWMPPIVGQDFNDFYLERGTLAAGMELRQFLTTKRARS